MSVVVITRNRTDELDRTLSRLPRPQGLPGHPLLSFLAGGGLVVRRRALQLDGGARTYVS